jgi:hypothetical protein
MVFELHSVVLGFHYYRRLFRDGDARARARRAFETLLDRARSPG